MKKRMGIVFIALLLAVAAGIVWGFLQPKKPLLSTDPIGKTYADTKGLAFFSFSESGDMEGGYYSLVLQKNEDGRFLAEEVDQPTHSSKEKIRRGSPDADTILAIEEVIQTNKMDTWTELPQSDLFALDAASTTVCYIYDGKEYVIEDRDELPDGGGMALRTIRELIKGALK